MATYSKKWSYQQNKQDKRTFSVMLLLENRPIIIDGSDVISCYFVEDIFRNSMSGKLVFQDRNGLQEFGAFSGNEKVIIIYGYGDKDRNLMFDIWKIGKMQQSGGGVRTQEQVQMEITFVDTFFPAFQLKRYSRSFTEQRSTDIIKYILNEMIFINTTDVQIAMEDSKTKLDFIMPYWTPRMAISHLMKRSKGSITGESGYLCYANTDDESTGVKMNVVTLNYLFSDIARTIDPQRYVLTSKDVNYKNKILEYWMTGLDRNSNAKLRGGSWKGYNFLRKKLISDDLGYSDGIKKSMLLGRSSLYGPIDDISSNISMSGENDVDLLEATSYSSWVKRYSMQFVLNVIVKGDENRFAGQQIEIAWPSFLQQQKFNEVLQGKWLIKSITHHFGPGRDYPYIQRLVLLKNAFNKMNTRYLVEAQQRNITTEKYSILVKN
jgi:hypothetical protein